MRTSVPDERDPDTIERLIERTSPTLRRALVVRFGLDVGIEAHAEAIAYGWQHGDRLLAMSNPVGYLFRVGQSAARRLLRWQRSYQLDLDLVDTDSTFTPELGPALEQLRPRQRTAVVLVHGYGFSYAEVAAVLDEPESSVRNHVHRGMTALRARLNREDPT